MDDETPRRGANPEDNDDEEAEDDNKGDESSSSGFVGSEYDEDEESEAEEKAVDQEESSASTSVRAPSDVAAEDNVAGNIAPKKMTKDMKCYLIVSVFSFPVVSPRCSFVTPQVST